MLIVDDHLLLLFSSDELTGTITYVQTIWNKSLSNFSQKKLTRISHECIILLAMMLLLMHLKIWLKYALSSTKGCIGRNLLEFPFTCKTILAQNCYNAWIQLQFGPINSYKRHHQLDHHDERKWLLIEYYLVIPYSFSNPAPLSLYPLISNYASFQ